MVSGSSPVVTHVMATGGLHAGAEARGASRGPGPPARHVNFLLLLGKYEEELIFFILKRRT